MTAEDIVVTVTRALRQAEIPHMTVGAFVGIYYGMSRTTDDADFVIQVDDLRLSKLRGALGPGFIVDPQPRIECVTGGTYYKIAHPDSDFEVELFMLRNDAHELLSFSRKIMIGFEGGEAPICTAEDFVITKLRWAKTKVRPKDIEDVRAVLAVQAENLDMPYIRDWCKQHETLEMLEDLIRMLPPVPPA